MGLAEKLMEKSDVTGCGCHSNTIRQIEAAPAHNLPEAMRGESGKSFSWVETEMRQGYTSR
jgi:hypothetical protein